MSVCLILLRAVFVLSAAIIAIAVQTADPARAQNLEIGVAAAVNPNAQGTPPAREARVLNVGVNVVHNELITTSDKGQAQMLFADQSALTIGPNSEMVLDEFVYDPATKTGRIALSATKGLFRLVGGRISKSTPVTLRTPTATIGIRGGIAFVDVAADGATSATFLFGDEMTVTNQTGTKVARRPGFEISVSSTAEAPSDPAPASAQSLEGVLGGLEGSAESTPQDAPQDQDVAAAGVTTGSDKPPSDVAPKPQSQAAASRTGPETSKSTADEADDSAKSGTEVETGGTQSPTGTTVDVSQFEGNFTQSTSRSSGAGTSVQITSPSFSNSRFTGSTSSGSFDLSLPATPGTFTVGSTSPFDTVSGTGFLSDNKDFVFYELTEAADSSKRELAFAGTPVTSVPTTGATFYAVQNDFLLGSNIPFVRSTAGGDLTVAEAESSIDTSIVWGTGTNATTAVSGTAQRAWVHRTLAISGQGSSQKSAFLVMGGEVKLDSSNSNAPYLTGGAFATSRTSASLQAFRIDGEVTTLDASATNTGKAQFFGTGSPDYFVLTGAQRTSSTSVTTKLTTEDFGSTVSSYQPQTAVLKADGGSLNTRTTQTRYGYSGGAVQEISNLGVLGTTTFFRNENSDPKDIVVKTSATTNKVNADINVTDAFGSAFSFLRMQFGDQDSVFGDGSSTTGESAFIDDKRFAASDENGTKTTLSGTTVVDDNLGLVTASNTGDFDVNFLPSGVTLCSCDFLTWGFWSGDIQNTGGVHEIIHLANWVAGEIPALSAISALSGSAAYSGHAIGTVKDGSNVFQAVGNWDYTFNFDSPASSTGTISSFDNGSYTIGGATLSSGDSSRNTISGNLTGASGTASGRSGSFLGSFMQNGTTVNAGMGGHFQVSGTNYQASGVFAAAK